MATKSYMGIFCRQQLQSLVRISRSSRANFTLLNRTNLNAAINGDRFLSQKSGISTPYVRDSQTETVNPSKNNKEGSESDRANHGVGMRNGSPKERRPNQLETEKDSKNESTYASKYFRQFWLSHSVTNNHDRKRETFRKYQMHNSSDNLSSSDEIFHAKHSKDDQQKLPDLRNPNERIEEEIPKDIDERRDPRLNIPLTRYGRIGKNSYYYTRKMSILGREGKVREAIAVLEHWMMVRDRVKPTKRTFVVLIGILGRAGYTDKAFELFGKMKQLGLDPEDHIYTSLFNACANCPLPERGLQKAENLLYQMQDKGIKPNLYTVKAAMKAMAICGNYPKAFAIMDEAATRLRIDAECFDHLLMACISDKALGFRRALQVWQKMTVYGVQPMANTFNLLIRSARDCGGGEPSTFLKALGFKSDAKISSDIGLLDTTSAKETRLHDMMLLEDGRESIISGFTKQKAKKTQAENSKSFLKSQISGYESMEAALPHEEGYLEAMPDLHQADSVQADMTSDNFADTTSHLYEDHDFVATLDKDLVAALSSKRPSQDENGSKIYEWWEDEPVVDKWTQSLVENTVELTSEQSPTFTKSLQTDESIGGNETVAQPASSKLISVSELKHPEGRLALLGGPKKLLSHMQNVGSHPEMRTYAQLLACLPNNEQSEIEFLALMEENGMKPDIDFLNDLMMRRNKRKKGESVRAVLLLISRLRLTPNMRTYAALALACHKENQAHSLFQDMKEANVEPNSVIMGHLICASGVNFTYKRHMLETMEELGLKPDKENIAVIERTIAYTKRKIIDAEKAKDSSSFYLSESYQQSFRIFLKYYREWLVRTDLSQPRHPWDAFKPIVESE